MTDGVTPQLVSSNSFNSRRLDREHKVPGEIFVQPVKQAHMYTHVECVWEEAGRKFIAYQQWRGAGVAL